MAPQHLVARASDSRPFNAEIVEVEIGGVTIYRPFGEFRRAKSYCYLEDTNGATCHTAGLQVGGKKVPRWFRTIEMARFLGNWSRLEVRAVILVLSAKNVSASAQCAVYPF
ncbi:hypothetical protein TNCV_1804851 [Trichonephila clavipes]|nr:hypothetical protein TNCV_1804851 [Trichonephila clavipes]